MERISTSSDLSKKMSIREFSSEIEDEIIQHLGSSIPAVFPASHFCLLAFLKHNQSIIMQSNRAITNPHITNHRQGFQIFISLYHHNRYKQYPGYNEHFAWNAWGSLWQGSSILLEFLTAFDNGCDIGNFLAIWPIPPCIKMLNSTHCEWHQLYLFAIKDHLVFNESSLQVNNSVRKRQANLKKWEKGRKFQSVLKEVFV